MHALLNTISDRLKMGRLACGHHTFKEFSETHDIPTSTYWQHENGKRALTVENLLNYAELFQVDPAWLLTGKGQPCGDNGNLEVEQNILNELEKQGQSIEVSQQAQAIALQNNKYVMINLPLLKEIFYELTSFVKNIPEEKMTDVYDYCFDLYNQLIITSTDENERPKLIKFCLSAYFAGLGIE